jgi:hypothetical protein
MWDTHATWDDSTCSVGGGALSRIVTGRVVLVDRLLGIDADRVVQAARTPSDLTSAPPSAGPTPTD